MNELEAFVILTSIPHLGSIKIRQLLNLFGSAAEAIQATPKEISLLPGFERILPYWQSWEKDDKWKHDLMLVEKLHAELVPFTDLRYPKALLEISDHPALLYIKGTLKPQDHRSIAIVGTRQASIYGNETAHSIAKQLVSHGFTVVSGLARGIDTSAHLGALEGGGRTQAVIGSGLSRIYPAENQSLAEKITTQGTLISEFSMATPPDRQNFPQRNRIVSGMTLGTLLIEAPIKSGAMITMQKALDQKRKLFALPGRVDNENFKGNHLLIKNGHAHLIENAADIAAHFQSFFQLAPQMPLISIQFDEEEHSLLRQMPNEEIGIDALVLLTAIPVQHINRILMGLMLKKAIKEFPGKIYKKIAAGNTKNRHN